jgi:hypothetical protein
MRCFAFVPAIVSVLARIVGGVDVVDPSRPDILDLDDRLLVSCPDIMSVFCRIREEATSLVPSRLSFPPFPPCRNQYCR